MKGKLPVKIPDMVIILLFLVLTGFSTFKAYVKPQYTIQVMVQGQTQSWIFPLDAEETISVRGPLGNTIVKIHGSEVWVESSPCDNQTCVAMGHARSRGDWVACLPNAVYFIIEGSDDLRRYTDGAAW